ncbi:hypothetical protein L484_016453 [Morus notabilis]|uniref:Uncharacterized protein n=1 Tax=Morus notabilis TaxID=981085 RepID=W9R823_9ROSA|nr:hypothetical protein L484_016453 [Morus notabilis]
MTTEDFSFPTEKIPSSTIDSPPLWRSPTASSSTADDRQEITSKEEEQLSTEVGKKLAGFNPIRSLSCTGRGRKRDGVEEGENEDLQEEKMDSLWEDFNEELWSCRSSRADSDMFSGDHHHHQMVELDRVDQALKLSKTRNNKPHSMVIVLKILKKLFLLQNHSPTHHHHNRKLKTSRPL